MNHTSASGSSDRLGQLAANLAHVEERIAAACRSAGRDRREVTLVVVTKTYPASDVRLLAGLGVRHVAENRDQEAAPKAAASADLPLSWHFVGQLQTNKARSVVGYADHVHSVDRLRLVGALSRAATTEGRQVGCLVQVALDAESGAQGESMKPPRRKVSLALGGGRTVRPARRVVFTGFPPGTTSRSLADASRVGRAIRTSGRPRPRARPQRNVCTC